MVFISYSSKNDVIAKKIVQQLKDTGLKIWFAPDDILPGRDYAQEIWNAIEKATTVILLFSKDANSSEHVIREIELTMKNKLPMYIAKLDKSEPTGSLGYRFSTVQYHDLSEQATFNKELLTFTNFIKNELAHDIDDTIIEKQKNALDIKKLLKSFISYSASDLYLSSDYEPMLRIDGELLPLNLPKLDAELIDSMVSPFLQEHDEAILLKNRQLKKQIHVDLMSPENIPDTLDEFYSTLQSIISKYDPQVPADELQLPLDLIKEFLENFLTQCKEFKAEIYDALKKRDFETIHAKASRLEGVAANLRISDAQSLLNSITSSATPLEDDFMLAVTNTSKGLHVSFSTVTFEAPPLLSTLKVHPVLNKLTHINSGIVIISGKVGSGKSTTLYSMLLERLSNYKEHVSILDETIEFNLTASKGFVTHLDYDFSSAFKAAISMDCDTIVIPHLDSNEKILCALEASKRGIPVYASMNERSVVDILNTLIKFSTPDKKESFLKDLAENIEGMIAQILPPKVDGGRVAVHEIMIKSDLSSVLIANGSFQELYLHLFQTQSSELFKNLNAEVISLESAVKYANRPEEIKMFFFSNSHGILTASEIDSLSDLDKIRYINSLNGQRDKKDSKQYAKEYFEVMQDFTFNLPFTPHLFSGYIEKDMEEVLQDSVDICKKFYHINADDWNFNYLLVLSLLGDYYLFDKKFEEASPNYQIIDSLKFETPKQHMTNLVKWYQCEVHLNNTESVKKLQTEIKNLNPIVKDEEDFNGYKTYINRVLSNSKDTLELERCQMFLDFLEKQIVLNSTEDGI